MSRSNSFFGEMHGTSRVFGFTIRQILKSKANLFGLLVFFIIAFFSVPISYYTNGGSQSYDSSYDVKPGYLYEEQLDYLTQQGVDPAVSEILSHTVYQDGGDSVTEYQERDTVSMDMQLGYIMIVFMCCMFTTASIIRIVIEEKSSKLVDLLMVSVKPLALLYGKVLAELAYMLITLLLTITGVALSNEIFGNRYKSNFVGNLFAGGLHMDGHTVYVLAVMIITALLGMLVFGLLSGLCGAGCTSIDESNSAMGISMLLIFAGYFIAIVFATIGGKLVGTILSLIPPISIFLMPARVMAGQLAVGYVVLSWAIMLFTVFALLKLAARVYSGLIIYNGSQKKFRQILKMARKGEA